MVPGGEEALDAVAEGHVDLLLLDCRMPDVDGYEVARRIREREIDLGRPHGCRSSPSPPTPWWASARRCLEAGMDDFLSKPFRLEELAEKLEEWLPVEEAVQD